MSDEHGNHGGEGDREPVEPPLGEPDLGAVIERAGGYREPPPAPRERIWSEVRRGLVESGRLSESFPTAAPAPRGVTPRWAMRAAAVVTLLGLGAGAGLWWSAARIPSAPSTVSAAAERPTAGSEAASAGPSSGVVRRSALDHLSVSEGFLAVIEQEVRDGRVDPAVASWASGLLGQTRLLMDSGQELDPQLQFLLQDLELILVQVVDVAGESRDGPGAREDARLLAQGLESGGISIRIASLLSGEQEPM